MSQPEPDAAATDVVPTYAALQVFPALGDDNRRRYKWRLRTADGEVCIVSGIGYTIKAEAHANAEAVKRAASAAVIEDVAG